MRFYLTHSNWVLLLAGDEQIGMMDLYSFTQLFGLRAGGMLVRERR